MAKYKLNKKQEDLVEELENLTSILGLNPDDIIDDISSSKARTAFLELAKDQIIRSAVILKYVWMDEFLNVLICWYYFGKKRPFPQLWRSKRFKSFNYFILEKLYLLQKLDLVKSIHDIPKWVISDLSALNELRNGIAHSFLPQNRRRKPEWKGQNVFERSGYDLFLEDMEKLHNFFQRFWRGSPEDIENRPNAVTPEEN